MRVLIIGNGGREHALAWKAAQSPKVEQVYVAPGNAGTALEEKIENIAIEATAIEQLANFAKEKNIDLTIVGPEAPLAAGIVDLFQSQQLPCFGPTAKAAQLESSKVFSKQFMEKYNIPTAVYACFTELASAIDYIKKQGAPIVIKADGLAAGKGVTVAMSEEDAINAVTAALSEQQFGSAGSRVVIEEFLQGEEASFIVMADGKQVVPLATSQDHKARDDGDKGPNTGGMGAYSPAPVVTPEIYQQIMDKVVLPTIAGMAEEKTPFSGFLYVGAMISPCGKIKVLEYNCRLGDPETQPIMMRLQSDLIDLCQAALAGQLDTITPQWDPRTALGVVLCAGGYPNKYQKGDIILGLSDLQSAKQKVFHAGTKVKDNQIVTNGGRVLCATTLGVSVADAQKNAYQLVAGIHWDGMYFRKDIGHRAIAREQQQQGK